eukprot:Hpha_TRINITY_DN35125_c0_g1::TRINITY_DN35125_c0_g1_i1::g.168407::m.168407
MFVRKTWAMWRLLVTLMVVVGARACNPATDVVDIWSATRSVCVRMTSGSLRCWGKNTAGLLGYDDTEERGATWHTMGIRLPSLPIAVTDLYVGGSFACGKRPWGNITCWGYNDYGQLGIGNRVHQGDHEAEMASLPPLPVPGSCMVGQMHLGLRHTCLLCHDSVSIYCLGYNKEGQLGVEDKVNRGDTPGWETSWRTTDIGGGMVSQFLQGTSSLHTCVVMSGGASIRCWGKGRYGNLGNGHTQDIGDNSGEMGADLASTTSFGGQTVIGGCIGQLHTCILYNTGGVECFGDSSDGQTGIDSSIDKLVPKGKAINLSSALAGELPVSLTCGVRHTCALSENGRVGCWGNNIRGQLG